MRIVVCVKHVPDATGDRRFEEDLTVDRVGVDGLLSELDEYAVEQALRLKEARPDDEITIIALTVGPEKAADALRKALQMGADEAVHVIDDAVAGSDAVATSLVLAKAVEKVAESGPVDLVLCGMASTDAMMSVVPAMLAERLDLPQVTHAAVLETQGAEIRIKRDGDAASEVIAATMPALVSVTDTGCGMSQETLRHLGEPFFSTRPSAEGTGLGVSMVHAFVRNAGGAMRVESEPGVGTRFELLLPVVPPAPAA